MQLHCENCQNGVNIPTEMENCRRCSKPPPPPSKNARPRYDATTGDADLDHETLAAFQDGEMRKSIPPFTTFGARLRAAQGLPEPKPAPRPAILQDNYFDERVEDEPPMFV